MAREADILVNCAGLQHVAPVHEFPLDAFRLLRLIEPAEVAELVAFLCSGPASFANGSSWVLDGGWSAR